MSITNEEISLESLSQDQQAYLTTSNEYWTRLFTTEMTKQIIVQSSLNLPSTYINN